jgi:YYY domain-containing protein
LVSGGLAVLFVGLAGNLDGAAQLRDGLWKAAGPSFESGVPVLAGLVRAMSGLGALLRGEARLGGFDFWRSTRLIGPEDPGPITEFPFFTFLYGDLHAHLLSLPLTLAAVGLSLALARQREARALLAGWPNVRAFPRASGLRLLGLLVLLGLLAGALRATNTWDYPTYLAAAVLGLSCLLRPLRREQALASLAAIGLGSALLFGLSSLLFTPYLDRYQLFYSGLVRSAAQTAPGQFLTVNGFWLFVLASYLGIVSVRLLAPLSRRAASSARAPAFYTLALPYPVDWPLDGAWIALGLAVGMSGLLLWSHGLGSLALLLGLAVWLLALTWRRWQSPESCFQFGLAGLAVAVLALPDLVTLRGDVGRMNTVFKFYLQAWLLLAVLSAVWVPRLVTRRPVWRLVGPAWRLAWLAVLLVLLLGVLIYPLRGGPARLGQRFEQLPPGLDGMAFMTAARYRDRERDVGIPADHAAIAWLQREVEGSPVILEASIGLYKWGSRVSTYTGLPTVIGWDWHQTQQRVGMASRVDARLKDVKTIYDTNRLEQALPLLRKYGVRYVYVGGVERLYYPNGVRKFELAPADLLEAVYSGAGVTIYEVKEPA